MAQSVKRAFKYRFYPTPEQASELARTFGCARLVYNKAPEERTRAYTQGRRISYVESSAALTEWKRTDELAFLNAVSSVPLQQALRHLQAAFADFFAKRARYPAFKSRKKSRLSAEYTRSAFTFRDGRLTLAKMDGPLDIVWSRPLPEGVEPSTVTVSKDVAGRWFVSVLCKDAIRPLDPVARSVGVDAGITALVTLSTGEKVVNPGGRKLVVIDRWFPCSKLCSTCGLLHDTMPLNVRSRECVCGASHDRDVNAARNILAAGPAER
ncbi:RNA-guided endonuclease InsQ/TnpB family protein [Nonomuraea mangrovi]|uniref:RNA-guided endonuclease InsQ/TnpB family protein n=1 Tax=Nonomuraea mangrovi TaxID=2316207 RepID=A0ABW4SMR7_9ACTN